MHNFTKMKYVNNREDLLREASENIKIKKNNFPPLPLLKKGNLAQTCMVWIMDPTFWILLCGSTSPNSSVHNNLSTLMNSGFRFFH